MSELAGGELRFAFGRNWEQFITTSFDVRRLVLAAQSLRRLLGRENLVGETVLDIGCGSGLFSLAACLLGAERVVAFDYDADSVRTSEALRARASVPPERWAVTRGSVLDAEFMSSLAPASVVYSWGVLHHTGAMWEAIDGAAGRVLPGGLLAIAIYNRVRRPVGGSGTWWHLKRLYNRAPALRAPLEVAYAAALLAQQAASGVSPVDYVRGYSLRSGRGMHFWYDVRDWMGGFPYEYATVDELRDYVAARGFELAAAWPSTGLGCNELTFRRLVERPTPRG